MTCARPLPAESPGREPCGAGTDPDPDPAADRAGPVRQRPPVASESIYALHPRHPMVLDQLRQVYLAREDWTALIDPPPAPARWANWTAPAGRGPAAPGLDRPAGGRQRCAGDPAPGLAGDAPQTAPGARAAGQLRDHLRRLGADAEAADLWLEAPAQAIPPPSCSPACPGSNWTTTSPCWPCSERSRISPVPKRRWHGSACWPVQLDEAQRLLGAGGGEGTRMPPLPRPRPGDGQAQAHQQGQRVLPSGSATGGRLTLARHGTKRPQLRPFYWDGAEWRLSLLPSREKGRDEGT